MFFVLVLDYSIVYPLGYKRVGNTLIKGKGELKVGPEAFWVKMSFVSKTTKICQ
jgi:hypothetical protein